MSPLSSWRFLAEPAALWPRLKTLPWWQLALLALWLFFTLVGAGNLLGRLAQSANARALDLSAENSLAVGPGFALGSVSAPSSGVLIPVRLSIPSIGVDASIEQVGVESDGSMGTPSSFDTVAWYKDGSKPGEPGNAVIDGHVNNALTAAGVFEHLDQLHLGDNILVSDASGRSLSFTVTSEQVYAVDKAPTSQIFATAGAPGLALITCDGAWDQGKKMFNERLVVYATLSS
jgi:LPXTG-site transpeptidase (sortase) family protein